MTKKKDKGGRPAYTKEELESILQKLAPYLQRGLAVWRACIEAEIPYKTVYNRMQDTDWFLQRVEAYQQFKLVLYSDIRLKQVTELYERIQEGGKVEKADEGLLRWLGENDKALGEQFGKKLELTGKDGGDLIPNALQDKDSVKTILDVFKVFLDKNSVVLEKKETTKKLQKKITITPTKTNEK